MAVKSGTFFWIECDECGRDFDPAEVYNYHTEAEAVAAFETYDQVIRKDGEVIGTYCDTHSKWETTDD